MRVVLTVLVTLLATLMFTPAVAGAVEADWDFYGEWGVADLTVDRETRNEIYVYEIENINGIVYIGGAFQEIVHRDAPNRPIDQAFIVAFDAESGDIISSFRPEVDHPVYAIAEHPVTGAILVGGEFTRVNGVDRTSLVALDPVTGETDPTFTGIVKRSGGDRRSVVRGIDVNASEIFVGGSFGRAKGTGGSYVRRNLAKFDANGAVDATWNVNVTGGGVWDLVLSTDDQRVIFGGLLSGVNGVSRPELAMVAAAGVGTLTSAFPDWQSVGPSCYRLYPGCLFVYDIDVQNGKVLVSGAEHFSSLLDDQTGNRIHQWLETNDAQAGLLDGDRVWRTRHGRDNTTGMYYAHDINTFQPVVTTVGKAATGAGGFEIEKGENGCIWIGGAIGGMDLANVAGTEKVATHHVGFMCPAGTQVPESQLNINNWETPTGLLIRGLRVVDSGNSFGVFSYTPAPDAVKHEIFLDDEFIAEDTDGSFAFSHLEPGTTHRVEVRATNAVGEHYSSTLSLTVDPLFRPRLDLDAGVSVSQINLYSNYEAGRANDEDTGNFSHTQQQYGSWWEMDLGSVQELSEIEVWSRSGALRQSRDLHVLVSDTPFVSDDLATNQAHASLDVFLAGDGKRPSLVELNTVGRYIRLQMAVDQFLSLAEVDVWGIADSTPEVVPHPAPYVIPNLNVHRFRQIDVGYTFGVFVYDPARDAVRHEVYLEGNLIDSNNTDGSFAFSQLEPGTSYDIELRAVDADGSTKSEFLSFVTAVATHGEQLDLDAGVSVSQINQYSNYEAGRANDEDTGNFSHTQQQHGSWWEMDLGSVEDLLTVDIWSRAGALHQSRDLHVLVSDTPFVSDDLVTNQAHASLDVFLAGNGQLPATVDLNTAGRYIRLQMDANEFLSLGEVDVRGVVDLGGEVVPHPAPYPIPNLNVHDFRQTDVGFTYAVFEYELAAEAVRYEVYLDGDLVGTDDDGSFAFSQLEASRSHEVELRAIGADGATKSHTRVLVTNTPDGGPQVDEVAGVSVSQISDYSAAYVAELANDDNTDNTSITKTGLESWWEIDLGSSQSLSKLDLWARTGSPQQTANIHVLVSDQPFTSDSLAVNQGQASLDVFLAGNGERPKQVDLNTTGRYVRLQRSDDNFLSIAEVDVWGVGDPGAEVVPHPDPFKIPNLNVHNFVQAGAGYTYGVFSYRGAPDAVKHEVYLDGRYLGNAAGGSFAISLLDPGATYEVKLRAVDVDGNGKAHLQTLQTKLVEDEQIDADAGVTVEQISDYSATYPAPKANDENVDNFSITKNQSEAWWQMDLGASHKLSNLELWARSGRADQTRNVHVLVSNQPFTSDSLADAQAQSSVDVFLAGDGQRPATVDLSTTGRYIRLQISDTNFLSVAEVNVWNEADANGEVVPHPNPLPGGVAPPPPPNGDLVCELDVDGASVDVNWVGTTTADSIIVYRTPDGGNRHWRGKVPAVDGTFVDTLGDVSYSYELLERTGNHFGGSFDCGDTGAPPPPPPPPPPPAGLTCEVSDVNGEGFVEWTGQTVGIDSIVIYRTPAGGNTHWRGKVAGTESDFTDSLGIGTYTYLIREKTGAVLSIAVECGDVTPGQPGPVLPTLACSVANVAGEAVVTLVGQTAADSVVIFRSTNGGQAFWRGKIDASETTFVDSLRPFVFEYEIRERTGLVNTDPVSCGSVQG